MTRTRVWGGPAAQLEAAQPEHEAATAAVATARDLLLRARANLDHARDLRIQHASLPSFSAAFASAELAVIEAEGQERLALVALAELEADLLEFGGYASFSPTARGTR